jgi:TorA maturation chaperone TorD
VEGTTEPDVAGSDYRSFVYGLLALAFAPPKANTDTLYASIHDVLGSFGVSARREDPPELNVTPAELDKEYLRLFVGPGHAPCPPYESVYRKDRPIMVRGLVMGPSTADVQKRYAEAGLKLSNGFADLPDHISAELEFMHFLCSQESKIRQDKSALELTRRSRQEFLTTHLRPWVSTFADSVLASTRSDFYRMAATLLKLFIKAESENSVEREEI